MVGGKRLWHFRSTDLLNWEQTDRLTFKEAWECPDLVCLKDEKGNETWMFWSADGYYFWGDFDGFKFQTDGVRHAAYINKMAYAAQTYSNTGDRVISVLWLRLPNREEIIPGRWDCRENFLLHIRMVKRC